jgi:ankyrin repeat protein
MFARSIRLALVAAIVATAPGVASAQRFSEGYTFLKAVRDADGSKVTEILNQPGVSIVNTKDQETGEGALHIVAKRGDTAYLRFLLQRDANPNLQDKRGNTALIVAVNQAFGEGVDVLITYKADVNLGNASGETPLILAVQARNLDLARTLLAAGGDPDRADVVAGMSARDYAKRDGRSPAMTKLLADAPKVAKRASSGPTL